MKKLFYLFPALIVTVLLVACKRDPVPSDSPKGGDDKEKVVDYFRSPAYVGDISAFSAEMQEAIREYFPMSGNKREALVLFIGQSDVKANDPDLKAAIDNQAFIVYPHGVDVSPLGIENSSATLDEDSGYTPLYHCYSSYRGGYFYTEYQAPEAGEAEEIESSWTPEAWEAMVKENEKYQGEEDGDDEDDEEWDWNESEMSMDALIDWLLESFAEQDPEEVKADYYKEMEFKLELIGRREHARLAFNLNKQIDKGTLSDPDILNCSSSVDVDFRYFPAYMQSANDDKAGDYYAVVSTITPHNGQMWRPFKGNHGGTQNRVIGYWFKEMNVSTSILNTDGTSISGLNYYVIPRPENKNDSKKYTTGTSQSISGTINGGAKKKGGMVGGSLTAGGTWSSSVSYELKTIEFERDTYDPNAVAYNYRSTGFKLKDGLGDAEKELEYYPLATRTEFSGRSFWIWHIPSATVDDNDTKSFKITTKVDLKYGSWHHWRGTDEFSSNEKTHPVNVPAVSWTLAAPSRVPWGIIALKNTSDNEMANVTVYDASNKQTAKLTKSFSKNEVAKIALSLGTYSVRWDIIDANTNHKLSSWKYDGVEVHQGQDEAAATTEISSVNGIPAN